MATLPELGGEDYGLALKAVVPLHFRASAVMLHRP